MSWERFAYICRKAKTVKSGEPIAESLSRIENEQGSQLYGDNIDFVSLPRKILNDAGKIKDNDKAKQALGVYADIDFSQYLFEPMHLKRATIYLVFVALVFSMISAIYQFQVAPSFTETFESLGTQVPTYIGIYRDYWYFFIIAVFLALLFSLVIGFTLKRLCKFKQGCENSFVLRFLAFRGIRKSYLKIMDILYFPLSLASDSHELDNSEVNAHLLDVEKSDLNLAVEMQALIKTEFLSLSGRCEKQMKLFSVFVAVIVIVAIFFFLINVYSPLFVMGGVV